MFKQLKSEDLILRIGINALNGIKLICDENWYDFTYHKQMDIIESIMAIVKFGIN